MNYFTFDNANNLDWSNDFIDFTIGMHLLLSVYNDRPEVEPFRQSKNQLIQNCVEAISVSLLKETDAIRLLLETSRYGATREDTEQLFQDFAAALSPTSWFELDKPTLQKSPRLKAFCENPRVKSVYERLEEFGRLYNQEYVAACLGGTLSLEENRSSIDSEKMITLQAQIRDLITPIFEPVMAFFEDIINLFFDSGLKCWWAPLIEMNFGLAEAISQPAQKVLQPTIDGVLGPLFRRELKKHWESKEQIDPLKKQIYQEYILAGMSRKEARRDLGKEDSQEIHRIMESWGYHHGRKWERMYFDCLFDRLYLKSSIESVAERYSIDPSTVQRNTGELATLLHLEIDRPIHKTIEH
jgi:hypothetical protein